MMGSPLLAGASARLAVAAVAAAVLWSLFAWAIL